MDLRPLDPDDLGTMTQVVDLENATEAQDAPWRHPMTLRTLDAEIRWSWDLEPGRHVVAPDGDTVVAHGVLELSERDNLDLAWFGISVPPDLRRRGHGTATLRHLEDEADGYPMLESMVDMVAAINDAPLDELDIENDVFSPSSGWRRTRRRS